MKVELSDIYLQLWASYRIYILEVLNAKQDASKHLITS